MTTWYVRPDVGSDSNAGNSYSTAWKSITGGVTTGHSVSSGDTVRIVQSPAATDMGQHASWTYGSNTVTLTTVVTATIDLCETAFTAATNVTTSTSTDRRQGSFSSEFVIGGGFTTGQIGYQSFSSTNFSAYTQLTFMIKSSINIAANTLKLALCSDSAGTTIVNSVTIAEIIQAGAWTPIAIDTGSALGSAIQSVAFIALLNPSTATLQLDNIIAAKSPSSVDSLTLRSLIGKNNGGPVDTWFAIESINGTGIILAQDPQGGTPSQFRGYPGTTQSVETWKRETFATPLLGSNTDAATVNLGGVTFSGGWDSTAMTTQVDSTWFDGRNGFGFGIDDAYTSTTINNLNFIRYWQGILMNGTTSANYSDFAVNNNQNCGFFAQNTNSLPTVSAVTAVGNYGGFIPQGNCPDVFTLFGNCNCSSNVVDGFGIQQSPSFTYLSNTSGTLYAYRNGGFGINGAGVARNWNDLVLKDNISDGLAVASYNSLPCVINSITSSGHGATILMNTFSTLKVENLDVTGDTATMDMDNFGTAAYDICLMNIVGLQSVPVINFYTPSGSQVRFHRVSGDPLDNRIYGDLGNIFSQGAITDPPATVAWQISPTSSLVSQTLPMQLSVKKAACTSGALTVTARIYRTSNAIHSQLRIPGNRVGGVTSDIIVSTDGTAGAFATYSISANPTEAGVIEAILEVWGGSGDSVYITNVTAAKI